MKLKRSSAAIVANLPEHPHQAIAVLVQAYTSLEAAYLNVDSAPAQADIQADLLHAQNAAREILAMYSEIETIEGAALIEAATDTQKRVKQLLNFLDAVVVGDVPA